MQKQNQIYDLFLRPVKRLFILVDPDKFDKGKAEIFFSRIDGFADMVFVGGSLLSVNHTEIVVSELKQITSLPVVLFPGCSMQVAGQADAILFLSLVSGRNPEFLIGQHVNAAPFIFRSNLEVIPTAYILIDGGSRTSVQYISQSMPIPADKPDIVVATALAGKYLGQKLIYLEAGSGSVNPVSADMVKQVSEKTQLPVIAGGGIRNFETARNLLEAGAAGIVIGSLFETDPDEVIRIAEKIKSI